MKKIYTSTLNFFVFFCIGITGIKAQCGTATNVPYFENFSSVTSNNQLPLCWLASNPGVTCLTYTTSTTGYAAFSDVSGGVSYFYTGAIQLNAGVVYSTSLFYMTDNLGGTNWTDLSILYGNSQAPAGLTSIVSTGGPASSSFYTALSSTFAVSSSGVYYIAVRGTGTTGLSHFLYWDDLLVTAPCSQGLNSPTLSIAASSSVICANDTSGQVTLTVTGNADNYLWNTGSTSTVIASTNTVISGNTVPLNNYEVTGTNTLSNCTSTISITLQFKPSPSVFLIPSQPFACQGSSVMLNTGGNANTFSWSTGATSASISVSPTIASVYTVTGISNAGCSTSATISLPVYSLPVISSVVSPTVVCVGEAVTFSANGANTYTWVEPGGNSTISQNFTISAPVNSSYTVFGTDINGCTNSQYFIFAADECTGLNKTTTMGNILVYPNPTRGEFEIDLPGSMENSSVTIFDYSGASVDSRRIDNSNAKLKLDIRNLAAGIYFLQIENTGRLRTIKVVKE